MGYPNLAKFLGVNFDTTRIFSMIFNYVISI